VNRGRFGVLLLAAQALALWPQAHWYALQVRYASAQGTELLPLLAALGFTLRGLWAPPPRQRPPRSLLGPALATVSLAAAAPRLPEIAAATGAAIVAAWTASLLATERRMHLGLLGLALLALPVVPLFQDALGLPLRRASAELAALCLRPADPSATAAGTQVLWRGEPVAVDAPCSGLALLRSTLFATCLAGTFAGIGNLRLGAALVVAVVAVVLGNGLRAAALTVYESSPRALPQFGHDAVGLVVQGLVLAACLAVCGGLRREEVACVIAPRS
jgi:exosortase/archaeosortase family protein